MSFTDPRPLAEFADLLPIKSRRWREQRSDELAGLGSGDTLALELATPLWAVDVDIDWSRWAEARQLMALVRSMDGPLRSFLMTNPLAEYPAADPDGTILGTATVTIDDIGSDNSSLAFAGLPAGYDLGWGDFGEVRFSSGPERRYVFEIRGEVSAAGDGTTALVQVGPHVWPGVAEGQTVYLKRPAAKFFIVPGTLQEGLVRRGLVDGWSFTALQRP